MDLPRHVCFNSMVHHAAHLLAHRGPPATTSHSHTRVRWQPYYVTGLVGMSKIHLPIFHFRSLMRGSSNQTLRCNVAPMKGFVHEVLRHLHLRQRSADCALLSRSYPHEGLGAGHTGEGAAWVHLPSSCILASSCTFASLHPRLSPHLLPVSLAHLLCPVSCLLP